MLARRFPSRIDFAALALAAGLILSLAGRPEAPQAAPMPQTAPNARIAQFTAPPAKGRAAQEWAAWAARPSYFGAFATSRAQGGAWGAATRYNSQALAREDALARCGRFASDCRIVALSLPRGPLPAAPVSLRADNTGFYFDYLRLGGARAFAVSDSGASGWSWGHAFKVGAEAGALAACTAQNAPREPLLSPAPCRIVASRGLLGALKGRLP